MKIEIFLLIAMFGIIITEAILIYSVLRLNKNLNKLNQNLSSMVETTTAKLHYLADKINFDIPKIIEQIRLMFALLKFGEKKNE